MHVLQLVWPSQSCMPAEEYAVGKRKRPLTKEAVFQALPAAFAESLAPTPARLQASLGNCRQVALLPVHTTGQKSSGQARMFMQM